MKIIYGFMIALAFAVLTAAGASRYINGTEIKQNVVLLNTTDAMTGTSLSLSSTLNVAGAVGITGDLTFRDDLIATDLVTGVTAATGSAQGDGPITNTFVQVTTSATNGDAVTLPTAVAGIMHFVCNNAAANSVDMFPAASDQINKETADTAVALAAGECAFCFAFSAVRWGCVIGSAN